MSALFELPQAVPGLSAAAVAKLLRGYRLPNSNEAELQAAVQRALEAEKAEHRREVTQGGDRIDFVVGTVGVELKVKGSVTNVTRQLFRYALWTDLTELLVVTTVGKHLGLPKVLNGKPITVHIARGMF